MDKRILAIDGACKRNGQPDCISAGGVFVQNLTENNDILCSFTACTHEFNSTNQRGEMIALIKALEYIESGVENYILTDSEYLFNALTKEWFTRWSCTGWITSSGTPVANQDLWEIIIEKLMPLKDDIFYYHIKGHLISVGKKAASKLLDKDLSGMLLYKEALEKWSSLPKDKVHEICIVVNACAIKSIRHRHRYRYETIERFACLNLVADAVATQYLERVSMIQS